MRLLRRSAFLAFAAAAACASAQPAADLPAPSEVLATLNKVNGYFMAHHPDPGAPIQVAGHAARPSNIWTRAVYYEGLMALYSINPDAGLRNYALTWAEDHHWGLNGGAATRVADNQCCGQTYLALYALDPQPQRIAMIKASVDNMVSSAKADDWWWCDALQMAMPVFARLGVLEHDPRYWEKMYTLYRDAATRQGGDGLYNGSDHLWWRDRTFVAPYREPNGKNCYWARGNGWVLAAMLRTIEILPSGAPHRDEYVRMFQDMAAALKPLQRADGFWNVSLLDPAHFGGKEVTGTSLFTYGFAGGIRLGLLPESEYRPAVARAWAGLSRDAVHPDGFLGYVQGTGKQPSDSQPVGYDHVPDFQDFGTGCFLLGGSEVWKLAGGRPADAN
ncbi:MAG TPA: glycoside hydrolase family 88 protein [Opitutaceae bacterium]|nr:glycoside hydrolase family 88 protein [Opitutaceae bacterium]